MLVGNRYVYRKSRLVARKHFSGCRVDKVNQRGISLCCKCNIFNILDITALVLDVTIFVNRILLRKCFSVSQSGPGLLDFIQIKLQFNRIFPVHQPVDHTCGIIFAEFVFPRRHRRVFSTVENGLDKFVVLFLLQCRRSEVGTDTTLVNRSVTPLTLFFIHFGKIHLGCPGNRHCRRNTCDDGQSCNFVQFHSSLLFQHDSHF